MIKAKKIKSGFTMIEMAVGTAITGILMAVAVCAFTSALTTSHTNECHDNLEVIANLEAKHRLKDPNHSYTTTLNSLNTDNPGVPKCPDGGAYTVSISTGIATAQNGQTVTSGKILISCSATGHGKYAPEIDTP